MFDARRIRQDFSDAAARYEEQTPLQHYVLSRLAGKMMPMLRPNAKVLDAGCGTGRFARLHRDYGVIQTDAAWNM